eukprot:PITA_12072
MVVQEKKTKGEIQICVELRKLNDACFHDPFPMPFIDEVLENVGGEEGYSFTDGFSRYHQIKITPEDWSKTTFTTEWVYFHYTVMPFGLKNDPAIFSKGLMVDPAKIAIIVNLEAANNAKQLHAILGHMGYYRKFIRAYAQITVPMERSLKKDETFCWDKEFHKSLDILKEKMVTAPILVFLD